MWTLSQRLTLPQGLYSLSERTSYPKNWWSLDATRLGFILFQLHQSRLWFITGGYLVKRWFLPAAARARGQSNDLNRGILASNLFNCRKEVINAPPVPSVSRCIHIVYQHKNIWEYQWSNFIYNCISTFLHYVRCKDALLDCRQQRPWWWKVQITNRGWWNCSEIWTGTSAAAPPTCLSNFRTILSL